VQRQKRLKQVWSSSIDTPGIFNDKKEKGRACFWASTQTSRPILEGFTSISYLFRRSWSACNVKNSHGACRCPPTAQVVSDAYFEPVSRQI
jgi:hypothetical protein